jgi:hypothetical protein
MLILSDEIIVFATLDAIAITWMFLSILVSHWIDVPPPPTKVQAVSPQIRCADKKPALLQARSLFEEQPLSLSAMTLPQTGCASYSVCYTSLDDSGCPHSSFRSAHHRGAVALP